SGFVRNRRRSSNHEIRSHRLKSSASLCRETPCGITWHPSREGMLRYREDFHGQLIARKPSQDTGPNKRNLSGGRRRDCGPHTSGTPCPGMLNQLREDSSASIHATIVSDLELVVSVRKPHS